MTSGRYTSFIFTDNSNELRFRSYTTLKVNLYYIPLNLENPPLEPDHLQPSHIYNSLLEAQPKPLNFRNTDPSILNRSPPLFLSFALANVINV